MTGNFCLNLCCFHCQCSTVGIRPYQTAATQQNADFGDTVTLSLLVPAGLTASFQADMIELTNGEISIQVGEQLDADFAEVADRLPPELL